MAKLPVLSGNEAVKAFNKDGWFVARKTGIINVKAGSKLTIFIPRHKERVWSAFGKLIMFAGLPVKKFIVL